MSECYDDDCLFYDTNSCTDCKECAYCGRHIDKRNRHMDHILARRSGGRTTVPVCRECNLNKGAKGLVSWLKWLHDNDKEKFYEIRDYNWWKEHKVAKAVRAVYHKNFHSQDLKGFLLGPFG